MEKQKTEYIQMEISELEIQQPNQEVTGWGKQQRKQKESVSLKLEPQEPPAEGQKGNRPR